jgi:MYXO-CTERM domain-containing protein
MLGSDPSATIFFGSDTTKAGLKIGVGRKKQHPMWTGDLSGGHDVGMLLMNFPYEDPLLAQKMNTGPVEDHVGDAYRHVGFGVYDRATGSADGQKRSGSTTVTGMRGDVILSGDDNLSVCFGDSGGPAYLEVDGEEVVAGIHSFTTGDDCFPPNGDTNVQLFAEDFILPWIQDNDPTCGFDGICAPIGCTADPDCEPCGADGTCTSDCELPDPDCPTQDIGEICRADSQCMGDQCIAYLADPEYSFCSRECDLNNDDCPSGMSCQDRAGLGPVCYWDDEPEGLLGDSCASGADCGSYQCAEDLCVVPCNLAQGEGCPADFACETRDDGANYYCFEEDKPDEGGCSVGGTRTSGNLAVMLLALVALVRRRRRA